MIERLFRNARRIEETSGLTDPAEWLVNSLQGKTAPAGHFGENVSAVQRCLAVRANTISKMPLQVYCHTDNGRERVTDPKVTRLLEYRPNATTTPSQLKKQISLDIDCWGNAYILIEGNREALRRLEPWRVSVYIDEQKNLSYTYSDAITGETVTYDGMSVLHFREYGFNSYVGRSKLTNARLTIENDEAARKLESLYYENGTIAKGMLVSPNDLSSDVKEKIRSEWQKLNGGMDSAFKVPILDRQLEYREVSMSFADAQFLDMRKYAIEEIARFFNVPTNKLGLTEGMKYNNVAEQNRDFIGNEIQPLLTDIEEELNYKFFYTREQKSGYFCRFNMESALRSDPTARADYYQKMKEAGALSINEIRAREDMGGIGDTGDIYWGNLNFIPLDIMMDYQLAQAGAESDKNSEEGGNGEGDL